MTKLLPPRDCNSMQALRAEIDELDEALVRLLAQRATYIDRAIQLKQINGWPARIPERVEDVVSKVKETAVRLGFDPELVEGLWRPLIEWSIAREAKVIKESEC